MCTECGCSEPLPFGVKVLRAIAPGLVQTRKPDHPCGTNAPQPGVTVSASTTAVRTQPAAVSSLVADAPGTDAEAETTAAGGRPSERSTFAAHTLDVHAPLLAYNDEAAAQNRAFFAGRKIFAVNLVSSPGAGKTTLLARTLDDFGQRYRCAVIVGDLETDTDARRLHRPNVDVAQITTGTACHLDATMVARGIAELPLVETRVLFIENVGNLVCPAAFDLGEAARVLLLSATEGEDKPLKYPPIFKTADLVVLTKIDVAELLGFDRAAAVENIRLIAPQAQLLELSARSGEGMERWYEFLQTHLQER